MPGRIRFLTVSIKTIKGAKASGVPWGIRWTRVFEVDMSQLNVMTANQPGRARDKEKARCLEIVRT